MFSRFAAFLFVSITAACLVAGAGSCSPDRVARVVDAEQPDPPASSQPSPSGGSSGAASDSKSAVGGASSSMSSSVIGGGGKGGQSSGGQSKTGGSGGKGGASASSASATSGGTTQRPDAGSAAGGSAGGRPDAAFDARVGGEVGPLACNDKTSNNRLGVYYYAGNPAAQTQDVQIHMAVINFTALTARLSQVTVRYWFTDEEPGLPNILTMYYTPSTLAKITTNFLPANPPRDGADTVLEFKFTPHPDAGVSFVETTEFNFAFHKDGYAGTYDQANDYSFDASLKTFGANPRITAYIAGELAWGCEPPVAADAGRD
jgi:hypothetical protein